MAKKKRRTLKTRDPVGPFLRAVREAAGLTIEVVAERMKTGKARISLVERGKAPMPSLVWIDRFLDACGKDAEIHVIDRE